MGKENEGNLLDHFPSNIEQLRDAVGDDIVPELVGYAGLVLAPVVGAVIHNRIIARRIKRIEDFLYDFCVAISEFEKRINQERIKSDEFEYLFIRTLDSVTSKQRKEKACYYRNLLIKHLLSNGDDIDREEIYLDLLDEVSLSELQVLSLFPIENKEIANVYDYLEPLRLTCDEIVRRLPEYSTEDLFLTFKSLKNKDLTANVIYPAGIDKRSNMDLYLSDLGTMFLHHIKLLK
jgi:hypothetical protein